MTHKHDYILTELDPAGVIRATRKCKKCDVEETLMWDFSKEVEVWVEGMFARDSEYIHILAADTSDYASAVQQLKESLPPDKDYRPLIISKDFELIKPSPFVDYYLADRWTEADILHDKRTMHLFLLHRI